VETASVINHKDPKLIQCRAAGCPRSTAKRYGAFCAAHGARKKRYGHEAQQTIRASQLKPHVERIQNYVARHGAETLWAKLEAIWTHAVQDARGIIAEARSGRPFDRRRFLAAQELLAVADTVETRRIVETVAALHILREQQPYAFKSDEAFWATLARRFRSLSSARLAYWDVTEGRAKKTLRDLRLDVSIALGHFLSTRLGAIGVKIAQHSEQERQALALLYQEAYAALAPVKAPPEAGTQ
jgi:hypothetical protein